MPHDVLTRNHVQVIGAGRQPIVFAHGFGCDQRIWRLITPAFAEQYQLVLFDYVGCGRSDLGAFTLERYGSLHGYAQDVLDICAALDLRQLIFVGHSISGVIGALASIRAPERFERLIMIGSSARYLNDPPAYVGGFERDEIVGMLDLMEKNYYGWANYMAPLAMQNADRPDLARDLEQSFRSLNPAIAREFARVTFLADVRRELAQITTPTLQIQSVEDLIVPAAAAEYLHQHLPANTQRQIQAIGHYPHVSHAAETIQLIQEYLAAPAMAA
jgi:sigma-B regulation protein RsbQ